MNIEIQPEHFEKAKKKIVETDETVVVAQTTGSCQLVILFETDSIQDMKSFANKLCKEVEGIATANVQAVLDVLKGSVTLG